MPLKLPHDHGNGKIDAILAQMLQNEEFKNLSEIFSLLADSTRLRIFWILCHSEECVINLSAIMGMSSPAISHHLKLLKSAELIISRREGKEVYYRSADNDKAHILHNMTNRLANISCPDDKCQFKQN